MCTLPGKHHVELQSVHCMVSTPHALSQMQRGNWTHRLPGILLLLIFSSVSKHIAISTYIDHILHLADLINVNCLKTCFRRCWLRSRRNGQYVREYVPDILSISSGASSTCTKAGCCQWASHTRWFTFNGSPTGGTVHDVHIKIKAGVWLERTSRPDITHVYGLHLLLIDDVCSMYDFIWYIQMLHWRHTDEWSLHSHLPWW